MGLKLRTVNFLDAKFSRLPLQKTARALDSLKANEITINLCRFPLEGQSRLGIGLDVAKINKLGVYHLNPNKVAGNIKSLADERTIKEIKFLGIKQIDVSAPFDPVKIWSNDIYKAVQGVLFGKPVDSLRKEYISTLYDGFYPLAKRAKTIVEKGLIANILFDALSLHDSPSALHQAETRKWAVAIAQQMGLPEEEILDIEFAAYLHDIGKLAIDAELLNKRGILDSDDIERIRVHVKLGMDILKNCGFFEDVISIVKYHHYLKSYPKCIEDGSPPIGSKILTVADSYEAMTGGRIYERIKTPEEAFLELRDPKFGYDQNIVNVFDKFRRKDFPIIGYHF